MITRPPILRIALRGPLTTTSQRTFSHTPPLLAKNRLYPSRIRSDPELQTLILMSSSSRTPLLTLWMTTWSRESAQTSQILQSLLRDERVGEAQGGVSFVEVEMDSPDLGGVAGVGMERYQVQSVPTLLAFDRGEAQVRTKVEGLRELGDREVLRGWIEKEAGRQGSGGAGGGGLWGLFGR